MPKKNHMGGRIRVIGIVRCMIITSVRSVKIRMCVWYCTNYCNTIKVLFFYALVNKSFGRCRTLKVPPSPFQKKVVERTLTSLTKPYLHHSFWGEIKLNLDNHEHLLLSGMSVCVVFTTKRPLGQNRSRNFLRVQEKV